MTDDTPSILNYVKKPPYSKLAIVSPLVAVTVLILPFASGFLFTRLRIEIWKPIHDLIVILDLCAAPFASIAFSIVVLWHVCFRRQQLRGRALAIIGFAINLLWLCFAFYEIVMLCLGV